MLFNDHSQNHNRLDTFYRSFPQNRHQVFSYNDFSFDDQDLNRTTNQSQVEKEFCFDTPPDAIITINQKDYLYFAGTGYLGLQSHPALLATACEAVMRYGVSAVTSMNHYTTAPVLEVRQKAAAVYQTENSLYCFSETQAMEILLNSLINSVDKIFIDEVSAETYRNLTEKIFCPNHIFTFSHGNATHLKQVLQENLNPGERPLLITEGVFPFHGTIAPIPDYMQLLAGYPGASLLIDDSHGLGVLGENGRGTLEYFHYNTQFVNRSKQEESGHYLPKMNDGMFMEEAFPDRSPLNDDQEVSRTGPRKPQVSTYLIASLSKAVGGFGAIIPGSFSFVEHLTETAKKYGLNESLSSVAAATARGLYLSCTSMELRQKLQSNTEYLKYRLQEIGIPTENSPVPIISFCLGTCQNMRRIRQQLANRQILISFVPHQKKNNQRGFLRIAVFATHEKNMLDLLVDTLKEVIN